ncbi:MAG TPA: pyridoxamine 5'-phosphate oxidase family protein [Thermoanaerobaculia bacterium]|nr:pyridoxamine 5'-phosphate oxidase family protein [Thermoanaerobaculia bacterium]
MRLATFSLTLAVLICFGASARAEPSPPGADRAALLGAAREIMTAVRYPAVVTVDASGRPQARVVDAFDPEPGMTVWFATNPKSRKVAQIRIDPRVTLYYFDPRDPGQGYVTLLGRARLVNEESEKQARWKEGWEAFWPDRGAGYLLVEVTPERLEIVSPDRGIDGDPVTWAPPAVELGRERPVKE